MDVNCMDQICFYFFSTIFYVGIKASKMKYLARNIDEEIVEDDSRSENFLRSSSKGKHFNSTILIFD